MYHWQDLVSGLFLNRLCAMNFVFFLGVYGFAVVFLDRQ